MLAGIVFVADKDVAMNKTLVLIGLCLHLLITPLFVQISLAQETININLAGASEMAEHLKGIGPAKADAIVKYRTDNGLFRSIEDLLNVKGIGKKTLNKLRKHIRIDSSKNSQRLADELEMKEQTTRWVVRNIIKQANSAIGVNNLGVTPRE